MVHRPLEQTDLPKVDQLFRRKQRSSARLHKKESCVIVGRLANYILKDRPGAYHVFISADTATEAARVAERDHISVDEAAAKEKGEPRARGSLQAFHKDGLGQCENYDLCIKSDDFGVKDTAKIIRELFQKKMGV